MHLLARSAAVVLTLHLVFGAEWVDAAYTYRVSAAATADDEWLALLFALQGIANRDRPVLFLDTGALDEDFPGSDQAWMRRMTQDGTDFHNVTGGLCGLVAHPVVTNASKSAVVYTSGSFGMHPALTAAGQLHSLPVSTALAERFECLAAMPVALNLTSVPAMAHDKITATKWALVRTMPWPRCSAPDSPPHTHQTPTRFVFALVLYPTRPHTLISGPCCADEPLGMHIDTCACP